MKIKPKLGAAFIVLMVVSQVSLAIQPDISELTKIYVMDGNPATTMAIRRDGDQYQIELSGGGDGLAGAATAADCFIRAEGKRVGKRLEAVFTAMESDTFTYSEREAKLENRKLELVFEPGATSIVHADTLGYCGLGTAFEGNYRLKPAQ